MVAMYDYPRCIAPQDPSYVYLLQHYALQNDPLRNSTPHHFSYFLKTFFPIILRRTIFHF
jgi:hypothetical protein